MRKLLVISAVFAVLGTKAFAQADAAISDAKSQCAAMTAPFKTSILVGKVDLDGELPSASMMAIDETPNSDELKVLAGFVDAQERCDQLGDRVAAQYAPWGYAAQSQLSQQMSIAYADLLTGKVSYGFTNRRLASAQRDFERAFIAARAAAISTSPAQFQVSPLASFGSALIGAGNAIQSATPPLAPIPPPVNCTSYQLGNMIQTRCQ